MNIESVRLYLKAWSWYFDCFHLHCCLIVAHVNSHFVNLVDGEWEKKGKRIIYLHSLTLDHFRFFFVWLLLLLFVLLFASLLIFSSNKTHHCRMQYRVFVTYGNAKRIIKNSFAAAINRQKRKMKKKTTTTKMSKIRRMKHVAISVRTSITMKTAHSVWQTSKRCFLCYLIFFNFFFFHL